MVGTEAYEKKMVCAFFLTWGFVFLNRISINFALPVIQSDLHLSPANIGEIIFIPTVIMALASIVVGRMSDKNGKRKKYLVPAILLVGIGSIATVFAQSYASLMFIRIVVGIGQGPILGMIFAITEVGSGENKFGTNSGIILAGDALIANIIGPILVTQLMKILAWQVALAVSAIPTIFVALYVWKEIAEVDVVTNEDIIQQPVNPLEILKYKNIMQCAILSVLSLGGYFTIVTYAPMVLTEISGYSLETMGMITSAMGVIFVVYAIVIPRATDKFGRKPVLILSNVLCAIAPLVLFLFPNGIMGIGGYVLFGGISATIGVLYNTVIPIESLPEHLKTTGSSMMLAISEIVGSAGVPLIAGRIADAYGYETVMLLPTGMFIVAFFISFGLHETNQEILKKKHVIA